MVATKAAVIVGGFGLVDVGARRAGHVTVNFAGRDLDELAGELGHDGAITTAATSTRWFVTPLVGLWWALLVIVCIR